MSEIEYGPTVYPSETEFSDFLSYISSLERQYSSDYGIVKVIIL